MIDSLTIPLSFIQEKTELSIVEVFLLLYIKQNVDENGMFTETDQQISKNLRINQSSLPTLISKLVKLIYAEHIHDESGKRVLRYVPVPNDSDSKSSKGYIYIMEDTALPGYYKIGFSRTVNFREKTLQAQKPSIRLIKKFVGSIQEEHAIHRYLDRYRVRGEWVFGLTVEQIEKAIKKIIGITSN